jgi:protein O-mannosyl-transferase
MTASRAPDFTRKLPHFGGFWPAVLIALAGVAVYANSFFCPFVYDDQTSVIYNRSIRHLATAFRPDQGSGQTVEGRPILNLSLALNYAISGMHVWSYHLFNLLIHILAGLTLFGIVRRTLAKRIGANMPQLIQANALHPSLAIALIWTVHPLQTESVTYIVQRAESLMGLFFLLTFYCFIRANEPLAHARSHDATRSRDAARSHEAIGGSCERERVVWYTLSVASFLLGVGTKEVIVAALPLLFLYDCVFVSGSLAKAWRAHRGLWISLICCLFVLAALVASTGWNRNGSIGIGIGVSPFAYALTQPLALLTYLKLCVLPFPLIFDYGTFWTSIGWEFCLQASAIAALLALTAVALKRAPALGFIGAWFFLVLAPTSLAPGATQMIVEHRMYLPLAAVVALLALALQRLLGGRSFPVLLAAAAAFGWVTFQRNETYRTNEGLWRDTIAKRPDNERALYALGNVFNMEGRTAEAIAQYEMALRLKPDDAEAHTNLGIALGAEGRIPEAIDQSEEAARLNPNNAEVHYNLGNSLKTGSKIPEAIAQYEMALRLNPNYAEAHNNLGGLLDAEGRIAEAVAQYEEALRLRPDYADAHNNLGNALSNQGRTAAAIAQYEEALRLKPDYADAHNNLGVALSAEGRTADAIAQYGEALQINPNYAEAHNNLGIAFAKIPGQLDEAIGQYEEAVRLMPDYAEAHNNMGGALNAEGRTAEAIVQYREALRINPNYAEAHNNLGIAFAKIPGQLNEAIGQYEEALRINPDIAIIHFNLAVALLNSPGRTDEAATHLKAVLRLQPDNDRARQILAQIGALEP